HQLSTHGLPAMPFILSRIQNTMYSEPFIAKRLNWSLSIEAFPCTIQLNKIAIESSSQKS
ncbi:MAG: hypothetical protein Q8R88_07240, partial [Desulfoprunum sp.]|nr:hypothetical protein [Desulfoprunum sp.]